MTPRTVFAVVIFCLTISLEATASPVLIVNSGRLTGATGLTVGTNVFNVQFVNGTCASVFGACHPSSFLFQDSGSALLASQAILNSLLVDGPQGNFHTQPGLTCGAASVCRILTPYGLFTSPTLVGPEVGVAVVGTDPTLVPPSGAADFSIEHIDLDTNSDHTYIWAKWSTDAATVAEASSLHYLSVGAMALILVWRRRHKC